MHKKRLKLLYFSLGGSEAKEYSLNFLNIIFIASIVLLVCTGVVFLSLSLFTDVFQNVQVAHYQEQNTELKTKIAEFEEKVNEIEAQIRLIEKEDEDLRVFVDLAQVDEETKQMGYGGLATSTYSMYSNSTDEYMNQALQTERELESLDQKMQFLVKSRDLIKNKYDSNLDSLRRIPSIKPVRGGRITSDYGYRIHPLTGQRRFHKGIDWGCARGTDVFAPADGIVVETVHKYTPNYSWGRYVLIDHGNGIQTRYAHLNRILVKNGQKVSRWTRIGRVGTTGGSTAPHLHYEVIVNGETTNPERYIFEDENG